MSRSRSRCNGSDPELLCCSQRIFLGRTKQIEIGLWCVLSGEACHCTRCLWKLDPRQDNVHLVICTVYLRFVPKTGIMNQYSLCSYNLLPRNRARPVRPLRAQIPSTATAAAQMEYHENVSSGAVVSMVIAHPPPAVENSGKRMCQFYHNRMGRSYVPPESVADVPLAFPALEFRQRQRSWFPSRLSSCYL